MAYHFFGRLLCEGLIRYVEPTLRFLKTPKRERKSCRKSVEQVGKMSDFDRFLRVKVLGKS
mgnify:FL=1